jgi:fatty-acyl-CoA synthase
LRTPSNDDGGYVMTTGNEALSIGGLTDVAADRFDRRPALIFGERRWSFAGLAAECARAARAVIAADILPGDRVAIWMANRPEWIFGALGALQAGAVLVPVNNRLTREEAAFCLTHSGSKLLFGEGGQGPVAGPRCVSMDGWEAFLQCGDQSDDAERRARLAAIKSDDPALIMYTSGTTGRPKGVVQTHRVTRNPRDCAERLAIDEEDVLLNFLPLFHCFSFNHMLMMSLTTGAAQVLIDQFSADAALNAAECHGATVLAGFDTHFRDLNRAAGERDMRNVKLRLGFLPAGLDSSAAVAHEAQQRLCPTSSCYGMTETWPGLTVTPLEATTEQRCEASGTPMSGYEFQIVDPDSGTVLPAGQVGEIRHRGYSTMIGYFNDADATAAAIDSDGWLSTGDMGVMRPDGHLRFMGRYKDMLKVGGENVSPAEVEAAIAEHPAVSEVAVVGIPHHRMVEVPVAFVVSPDRDLAAGHITEFCASRLAPYKVPRTVILIDTLPTTSSGKVQKNALRTLLENEAVYLEAFVT